MKDREPEPTGWVTNRIEGGVFLGPVVQGRDVRMTLPAEVPPATTGMPRPARVFVGREDLVETLLDSLAPGTAEEMLPVSAVAGMAGIGKTELVLQVADRALSREGWFPGGVLFVDLFGYDPDRRLSAADALASWLQAMGVPGDRVPSGEQERARLWRSVLSAYVRQDRRLLLIIDNAADTDQVAPLLPADPDIPVLVTSRHTLNLDARLYELGVLDSGRARDLIIQVVTLRRGNISWLDEPDQRLALAALVEMCGGLPLALRIVAALLADRPQPASLAEALRDTAHRLKRMARRETTGEVAVRAAFELSYRNLTPQQARLFRRLPINPGPDISTASAAQLVELPIDEVTTLLQDLHRAHLVDEPVTDRWRMHDLIRLFAREQPAESPDETDKVRRRLFAHYQHLAESANTHLSPTVASDTQAFATHAQALAWLDVEHANLVAVCASAVEHHLPQVCCALAIALSRFFHIRASSGNWITVSRYAVEQYRQLGDRRGEGRALNNLGLAFAAAHRFDEAVTAHTQALNIFRHLNDRFEEGGALMNLGGALLEERRFDEAIVALTDAIRIQQDLGQWHSLGQALVNFGRALSEIRQFDKAIQSSEQGLKILRRFGDRLGEVGALINLGGALVEVRRFDEAIAAYRTAVDISRELNYPYYESRALVGLGGVLRKARRFDEAILAYMRSLGICRELGEPYGEGQALMNLGVVRHELRHFDEAISVHRQSLEIFRQLGDESGEALALMNLGSALREKNRFDEAMEVHAFGLKLYRQLGNRQGESMALGNLGITLRKLGRFDEAMAKHAQDLKICRQLGDRHGEGNALSNLGLVLAAKRQFGKARALWGEAVRAYEETNDTASAAELRRLLDSLPQPD